ncbi:MAG: NAD(+)/NADH kinase [bacterium]
MKALGLFFKDTSKEAISDAKNLLKALQKKYRIYLVSEQAKLLNQPSIGISEKNLRDNISFLIVVGGDGTILRAARMVAPYSIPILGINIGKLGFLTEVEYRDAMRFIPKLIQNKYKLDKRKMLEAHVFRNKKKIAELLALNDIVIGKNGIARTIKIHTYVNEHIVAEYSADGLIVSTPTGSTGHNLSAGGPILAPHLSAMILTPICPHLINNRSVVVSHRSPLDIERYPEEEFEKGIRKVSRLPHSGITAESIVRAQVQADKSIDINITTDGQIVTDIRPGDDIVFKISNYVTEFIRFDTYDFFGVLRKKLNWK